MDNQQEYDLHLEGKNDAIKAQADSTFVCANFDLEAVLYNPLFFSNPIIYKRKLASFHFTIYVVGTKQCHCFFLAGV